MTERRDFITQLNTEYYNVYLDRLKRFTVKTHTWSSLEELVENCKLHLNKQLEELELEVGHYYINVDKLEVHYYSRSKPYLELPEPGWWV